MTDRELLTSLFHRAIAAVDAEAAVRRSLESQDPGPGPFWVLAAGKAACAMARAAQLVLGPRSRGGRVVTKDGHASPVSGLEVAEASHPLPDPRSVAAAREALQLARSLDESQALLVLLSGGASALWTLPATGLGLAEKRGVTDLLMRAAADIQQLNTVRKHLSDIKGGGLLRAAWPARVLTLAVSDVAGDAPELIGSGPSYADSSTYADALAVLRERGIEGESPGAVREHLEAGSAGLRPETLEPGEPASQRAEYRLVATLEDALQAVVRGAEAQGLRVRCLKERLSGEARTVAGSLAREALQTRQQGADLLVAGGEPVVRVTGSGKGGRAQELALAFALEMQAEPRVSALFAGTDGSDGPTDAAGGLVDAGTLARAQALGLDAREHLERNDSYRLLEGTGDLFITGPTQTNVTDLALIRLGPSD